MLKAKGGAVGRGVFSVIFLLGTLVYGQTTTGTILGTVADETGARVPAVTVTITNVDTGIPRSVTTDSAGRYRAPNLALGQYEVKAELTGFRTAVRRGIQLTVGSEAVVELALSVGTVAEVVEVTAEAPMVETTSATVSGLVANQQIQNLPLNARSFEGLALLQTGVAPYYRGGRGTEEGAGLKFSVTGSRFDANLFLLDGTNINDQSNMSPGSAAKVMLGVDAVREFRVLTSTYSAEYGRKMGGVVNVVTKSGTNELHGTALYFHRNDNADARNFFAREKPEFKLNQFGGTLGGPILRDRTFFFAGYEGLRQRKGEPRVGFVPIEEAHSGLVRDGQGNLNSVGVHPSIAPYLALIPKPNGAVLTTPAGVLTNTAEVQFNAPTPTNEDYVTGRMDHRLNDFHSFYGRYTISDSDTQDPSDLPIFRSETVARNQYVTLEETAMLSPTVINVARFGFSRSFSGVDNNFLANAPESLWFHPGQQFGTITFRSGGLTQLGTLGNFPQIWARNNFQLSDDLTIVQGRQTLKMGFLMERYQENSRKHRDFGGTYAFDSLEAFLRNQEPFSHAFEPPGNDPFRGARHWLWGAYLQDDIQVRPNLTLNLGLRWELPTVWKEVNGKLANYHDPLRDRAEAPHIGDPWFFYTRKDFAPRVGLAWDPFSNGKTAIRAGFGMYHDHVVGSPYNRALARVFPFHQFSSLARGRTGGLRIEFPRLIPSMVTGPNPLTFTNYLMGPEVKDPTKVGWSFTIQQELAPNNVVSVGYVGSRSSHLPFRWEGNAAPTAVDAATGRRYVPQPATFRNPNLGQLSIGITNVGMAAYHGLLVSYNRRLARGLQAQLSYTWSKNMSDSDGPLGRFNDPEGRAGVIATQDSDNFAAEWSLSQFDMRNSLSANFVYELSLAQTSTGAVRAVLGGWALNGIVSLYDGQPQNVVLGTQWTFSNVNSADDRPDLKPGGNNNPVLDSRNPNRYFDPEQFLRPPGDSQRRFFGNLGRNTLISPGVANFDFSLVKNTRIGERGNLQFRTEFFNLFNRTNFGLPFNGIFNAAFTINPTAGKIRRTVTENRQMQFGLKYIF